MKMTVVAVALLQFTGGSGNRIDLNPSEVSSIRELHKGIKSHWGPNVHCLLIMANGKFVSVRETCDEVRKAVQGPCALVCGDSTR